MSDDLLLGVKSWHGVKEEGIPGVADQSRRI
jgi:hypothetical protein